MKIKSIIKNILPIFAVGLTLLPVNTITVKAAKLDVVKTYTYSANLDGTINNPDRFFYVPSGSVEGSDTLKYAVVPDGIKFTVEQGATASISYEAYAGSNSSGSLQVSLISGLTSITDYKKLYYGDYTFYNMNGEMYVHSFTVTVKSQCYYDEYKEAISKGLNWTLVNGDVATAECTCKTECTTQATNTECPVCKTDIAKCTAKEEATSNTSNTDAAKAEEEKKKAEEAKKAEETKKAEEQKKAQEATAKSTPTTADSGVATTASADPSAVASEELALAQGQASQIIADAQLEAQAIIETANGQAEIRLAEANEQASQILLDAGITVGEGNKTSMPLGGMIALIILIIAVIGEGGVIAYTLLKNKLK